MDNILLVSNIFLWLLVLGLATLVLALARQIGVLYERVAPAGALMVANAKLEQGQPAPQVIAQDINSGNNLTAGKASSEGRSQLLFFLSPDCPVCKTLLPVIKSSAISERDWLDTVLASDGDLATHQQFIAAQQLQNFPYLLSEALGKQYAVAKLPFAVLIDEQGTVVSHGLVNSREHLESLFEAKERGVPTIQAYFDASTKPDATVTHPTATHAA